MRPHMSNILPNGRFMEYRNVGYTIIARVVIVKTMKRLKSCTTLNP